MASTQQQDPNSTNSSDASLPPGLWSELMMAITTERKTFQQHLEKKKEEKHRTDNREPLAASFTSQSCLNSNSVCFSVKSLDHNSGGLVTNGGGAGGEGAQPALSFNVPLFYSSRCNQHFMKEQFEVVCTLALWTR